MTSASAATSGACRTSWARPTPTPPSAWPTPRARTTSPPCRTWCWPRAACWPAQGRQRRPDRLCHRPARRLADHQRPLRRAAGRPAQDHGGLCRRGQRLRRQASGQGQAGPPAADRPRHRGRLRLQAAVLLRPGRRTEAPDFTGSPPAAGQGLEWAGHAPSRSADGATRLLVNSHQPYTGPVAWYEAVVESGQGWHVAGGFFPGAPFMLHGHNATLGWANTVSKPDLVDIYRLTINPRTRTSTAWTASGRTSTSAMPPCA
jgi:hypothetical protein